MNSLWICQLSFRQCEILLYCSLRPDILYMGLMSVALSRRLWSRIWCACCLLLVAIFHCCLCIVTLPLLEWLTCILFSWRQKICHHKLVPRIFFYLEYYIVEEHFWEETGPYQKQVWFSRRGYNNRNKNRDRSTASDGLNVLMLYRLRWPCSTLVTNASVYGSINNKILDEIMLIICIYCEL